jgi:U4/U6.U5 tri-snRNP component SNU23
MSGNPVGIDNTSRRKFDKEEYLERARQREQREKEEARKGKERGPPVQRQPLKHRDYEVDLESRLGKTQVVTPIAPLNQQAGYYCSVCECVVKDSANYLDHINGKKHQRALGMSMRVERASLEQATACDVPRPRHPLDRRMLQPYCHSNCSPSVLVTHIRTTIP